MDLHDELAPLLTIHEPCGQQVLFNVDRRVFVNVDGHDHACSTLDADECECGEPLLRSRFGRLRERDSGKAHLCALDVDRAGYDAAADRGSWSKRSKRGSGWTIPLRKLEKVGRSFLP